MKTNMGKLTPLKDLTEGIWMAPETARHYFRNGKGIALGTLKNKIGRGELMGRVKWDHTGWYVWVSNDAIKNKQEMQRA